MRLGLLLLLTAAPFPLVEADDFGPAQQKAALAATVRVTNGAKGTSGSGVVLGGKGGHFYVLTAQHVVDGADEVEVETFAEGSYPDPEQSFRGAKVVARRRGVADLALLRVATRGPAPKALPPSRPRDEGRDFPALAAGCSAAGAPTCEVVKVAGSKKVRREPKGEAAAVWEVRGRQAAGRSGGPLLGRGGRLIGLASGVSGECSYFCHAREIEEFLTRAGFGWLLAGPK